MTSNKSISSNARGKKPITIDGKQYLSDDFDEEIQDQITSLTFVDTTIKSMNFEVELLKTLRQELKALREYTDDIK